MSVSERYWWWWDDDSGAQPFHPPFSDYRLTWGGVLITWGGASLEWGS